MPQEHIWMMYYLTVVGWSLHPGHKRTGENKSEDECAAVADAMLHEHNKRWGKKWPTGQQQ